MNNSTNLKTTHYEHTYSFIKGLQKEHRVTYSVFELTNGILISLSCMYRNSIDTLNCFCKDISFTEADNLVRYLYENGVSICNWTDFLDVYKVDYNVIGQANFEHQGVYS